MLHDASLTFLPQNPEKGLQHIWKVNLSAEELRSQPVPEVIVPREHYLINCLLMFKMEPEFVC